IGSSYSIIEHQAVKPIYFILNYLYCNDYLSLLKFLRSDLVGINNKTLKYFLRNKKQIEKTIETDYNINQLDSINNLIVKVKKLKDMNYNKLIHHLFNEMGLFNSFKDQADTLKNLYFFYELTNQFNSINSLMNYIEENKDNENLQQVGIKDAEAVKLSTIHRAKGLTFNTVYFYFKPKISGSNFSSNIKIYIDFDQNYDKVKNYLLTNTKYNKILESLSYNFIEEENHKKLMEEINNNYVAMTRAANNLFIYVENPRRLKLGNSLCWSTSEYGFYETPLLKASNSNNIKELLTGKDKGGLIKDVTESKKRSINLSKIAKYFEAEVDQTIENKKLLDYQMNKNRLMGTIAHDYLEHIKYSTDKEHKIARDIITDKFVNIVGINLIDQIISTLKEFIKNNQILFDKNYEIFTEYTLFDGDQMKRIDRLMIDRDNKKIKILDYKTGKQFKEEQLNQYAELIKEKVDKEYLIETGFISINL
ncbi:MAG: hypothetical protein K9K32_06290, partial [Halanaerobiales bacterium]|nr:hypothetical protein [Halanaerobiales bacterium]